MFRKLFAFKRACDTLKRNAVVNNLINRSPSSARHFQRGNITCNADINWKSEFARAEYDAIGIKISYLGCDGYSSAFNGPRNRIMCGWSYDISNAEYRQLLVSIHSVNFFPENSFNDS